MLMKNVGSRLDYHVCKTLADLRYVRILWACFCPCLAAYSTREIFDIIIDYPDSRPALDDMKVSRRCIFRRLTSDVLG